jgi:NitT/TauT family transport system permease protein
MSGEYLGRKIRILDLGDTNLVRKGLSLAGVLFTLLSWVIATEVFQVLPESALPSPFDIYQQFTEHSGLLIDNLRPTLTAAAVGFVAAVSFSFILAIILTSSETLKRAFMPILVSGNSVPRVSLAPVIIFYIGGFQARYLIAAWVAFFPMLVNTMEGLENIPKDLEHLLESINATKWQEYKLVRIQNALPHIFDGLKISVTLSIIGAIVGEYVAADSGMGFLALYSIRSYNIPLAFGIALLMGMIAVATFWIIFITQDRVIHWKQTELFPN